MDEHARLTFLTIHYYDLQGLRAAPLWIAGLFSSLIRFPEELTKAIAMLLSLVAILALWFWLAGRYYRKRFGWLKPDPSRLAVKKPRRWYFSLVWIAVCSGIVYCWLTDSNVWGIYLFLFLLVERLLDPEDLRARRIYYGAGAVLVAGAGLFILLRRLDKREFLVVLSATMLALAIADHWLLLHLLAPARRESDE